MRTSNVTVRIPAALREFADGRSEVEVDAKTVADALAKIGGDYPLIMERIVDQRGAIRPYVNVFVGATSIRDSDGMATAVSEGDIIAIIPAVAGG